MVPFVLYGTQPQIACTIDGIPAECTIDTGARDTMSFMSPFIAAHPEVAPAKLTEVGINGFGFGGPAMGKLGRVREVGIDDLTLTNLVAGYSTQTAGGLAAPFVAANIGGNLLRRFTVTFDYGNGTMTLVPNAAYTEADSYERSGLFLIKREGNVQVVSARARHAGGDRGHREGRHDREHQRLARGHDAAAAGSRAPGPAGRDGGDARTRVERRDETHGEADAGGLRITLTPPCHPEPAAKRPCRRAALATTLAALLAGCGGAATQPPLASHVSSAVKSDAGQQFIFVTNNGSEIDEWPLGANGNVAPSRVIGGAATGLREPAGIVVDDKGEIYVAVSMTNAILGFPPNSNGNIRPNVHISGPQTGLDHPVGLAFDAGGNIYVSNCGLVCGGAQEASIEEFPPQASGNIAPTRKIAGDNTGFTRLRQITVGKTGEIYAANAQYLKLPPSIEVFAAGANGNRAPLRVIAGNRTDPSGGGIAVGKLGIYTDSWAEPLIERFAPKAHGNVPPVAQIEGSRTGLRKELDGLWLAPSSRLFAVDRGGPQIIAFAASANGNVAPLLVIAGSTTRLNVPMFVTVGRQP